MSAISRTILPLYLPCGTGWGSKRRVGTVCCCVVSCLEFQWPDNYRTNPWRLRLYLQKRQFFFCKLQQWKKEAQSEEPCQESHHEKKTNHSDVFIKKNVCGENFPLGICHTKSWTAFKSPYLCLVYHLAVQIIQGISRFNLKTSPWKKGLEYFA